MYLYCFCILKRYAALFLSKKKLTALTFEKVNASDLKNHSKCNGMWWKFGQILTDKLIYSPIVICKQILDVQTYGTSCLFSLSALQFEAQKGISIGWKQEPWRGKCLLFWDTVQTHYDSIKASLVGKKQRKDVRKCFLDVWMLFINSRGHKEAMKTGSWS